MEIGSLDSFHQVLPLDAIRRPLKPILQTEEQKLCKGFEWVPWPVNQLVGAAAAAILDECEAAASVCGMWIVCYMCRTHDTVCITCVEHTISLV